MCYYQITIYLVEVAEPYTFKIDEQKIFSFIELITEHVSNLESFYIYKNMIPMREDTTVS